MDKTLWADRGQLLQLDPADGGALAGNVPATCIGISRLGSAQLSPQVFTIWVQLRGSSWVEAREGRFRLRRGEWMALERDSRPQLQTDRHGVCIGISLGADALKAAGVNAEFLELTMDPGQQAETLSAYLRRNPDTVAATSTCDVIDGFLAAKADSGRDDLILTGYDIVAQSLEAIKDGRQAFTIDQQQFWRGYMPVLLLTHYLKYGLIEGNYFLTGPTVVDAANVERVSALVQQGYH